MPSIITRQYFKSGSPVGGNDTKPNEDFKIHTNFLWNTKALKAAKDVKTRKVFTGHTKH